jgi:hypothetical protein
MATTLGVELPGGVNVTMPTSRELVEPSGARAGRTNRMLAQDGLPLETRRKWDRPLLHTMSYL